MSRESSSGGVRQGTVSSRESSPDKLRIPEGWAIESLERRPDFALITTPSPLRYMVTVDFRARGFRSGYSTTSKFVGEEWNTQRKKYGGRGWRQMLVDDAVDHLRGLREICR